MPVQNEERTLYTCVRCGTENVKMGTPFPEGYPPNWTRVTMEGLHQANDIVCQGCGVAVNETLNGDPT